MTESLEPSDIACATAEEVLRVIYGDDLQGCTANLDDVIAVIRAGMEEQTRHTREVAGIHAKAFEAIQLLSTPPPDGEKLSAEDLRSLIGDRLDKIRDLAAKVLRATMPRES